MPRKTHPAPEPTTPQEKLAHALGRWPPKPPRKPRRRLPVKGHPTVERGSPAASDLFWAEVVRVMAAQGKHLPDPKPYGFPSEPSPVSDAARATFRAWARYDREQTRSFFMRMTPSERENQYWFAVDHAAMGGHPRPDSYIFGYDEHPVRPDTHPEPDYVRIVREAREADARAARGETRASARPEKAVADAFSLLGLPLDASPKAITKAFRLAALRTHPDRGGSPKAFAECLNAKTIALNHHERTHPR